MTPAARAAAAIGVLDSVFAGDAVEKALLGWARRSRYAGSGDRAAVRDIVFDCLRCRRSFAVLGGAMTGRGLVIGRCRASGPAAEAVFTGEGHAPAALSAVERAHVAAPCRLDPLEALDCPEWLAPSLGVALGDDFSAVMRQLRRRAPMFLRVNTRRATLARAVAALAEAGVVAHAHPLSKTALEVVENARKVSRTKAYESGLVEVQALASQAAVELLAVESATRILDFCAGGGGKTLAMAARAFAPIVAHDADAKRMTDLPARAARAGAEVEISQSRADLARASFDLVVCDVPCSGSGTWARNPEAKWRFAPPRLADLCAAQAGILAAAARLVAPGGTLAYMTCSLLREENEDQTAAFMVARGKGWRARQQRRFSPLDFGDGFYIALFQRD